MNTRSLLTDLRVLVEAGDERRGVVEEHAQVWGGGLCRGGGEQRGGERSAPQRGGHCGGGGGRHGRGSGELGGGAGGGGEVESYNLKKEEKCFMFCFRNVSTFPERSGFS